VTRWTFWMERVLPVRAFFSHISFARERGSEDAMIARGMCEINDAAQLGVINREITMVMIINIVSLVRDNRSRQAMKLRLK